MSFVGRRSVRVEIDHPSMRRSPWQSKFSPQCLPHLVVDDAAAAIDFYVKAFGAVEHGRVPGPDGKLIHASLAINGSSVMLNDDFPEMSGGKSMTPKALGGISGDHPSRRHRRRHRSSSRPSTRAPPSSCRVEDQFWGDRYGVLQDPFGHQWSMGQPVREVSIDEIARGDEAALAPAVAQRPSRQRRSPAKHSLPEGRRRRGRGGGQHVGDRGELVTRPVLATAGDLGIVDRLPAGRVDHVGLRLRTSLSSAAGLPAGSAS